jgi:hypothetical protein
MKLKSYYLTAAQKVSHVNAKTQKHIEIFLRHLSAEKDIKKILENCDEHSTIFELIRESLYSLDGAVLDLDRINGLLQGAPEPTEIEAIKVNYSLTCSANLRLLMS